MNFRHSSIIRILSGKTMKTIHLLAMMLIIFFVWSEDRTFFKRLRLLNDCLLYSQKFNYFIEMRIVSDLFVVLGRIQATHLTNSLIC